MLTYVANGMTSMEDETLTGAPTPVGNAIEKCGSGKIATCQACCGVGQSGVPIPSSRSFMPDAQFQESGLAISGEVSC